MNRRIIFRGYNLKNKRWLYGYYLVNRGKHFIVQDETVNPFAEREDFEVDPESVGQYVGEYEGKPIFECDIVEAQETDGFKMKYQGTVNYDPTNCRFVVKCVRASIPITGEKQNEYISMGATCSYYFKYRVIGNEYEKKLSTP